MEKKEAEVKEEVKEEKEEYIQTIKADTSNAVQPKNNMALAGFICSLSGLVTCGIVSIVGLVLSIIGLKKDDKHRTSTIIDKNLNTINVDSKSSLFLFLTKIQDEVHRFTISYHITNNFRKNHTHLIKCVLFPGNQCIELV